MAWEDTARGMFKRIDEGRSGGFSCAVGAVLDRTAANTEDYGFSGYGSFYKSGTGDLLIMEATMTYGGIREIPKERWLFEIERDTTMKVSMGPWRTYSDLEFVDLTYTDKGGGNFVSGYVLSPRGWWQITFSLDSQVVIR